MLSATASGSYLLVAVSLLVISAEPRFGTPLWISAGSAVCGVGVLVVRRRHPRVALAAALLLTIFSLAVGTGAESILVVITLYRVAATRTAVGAWSWFGAAMAFGVLGAATFTARLARGPSLWGSPPVTPRDPFVDGLVVFGAIAAVLLITALLGTSAGQRRRSLDALVERAEQLSREREQLAEIAVARERERIAREMHDVIAHSLTVMIAISDGARAAADERPDEAKIAIARVAETGRRTLGEVRRLLGAVRQPDEPTEPSHAPQPDATQIAALVDGFAAAGLPVQFAETGTATADPAVGITVYRIVQESLTNVLRHAQGVDSVSVALEWAEHDVTIRVEDAAASVSRNLDQQDAGRGILGMKERVAMFDGSLEIGPREGGGWRVCAHLHWEDE
ncbi:MULTISPECIES: sensor histidine kinase [unclassified Microbacterium]|uniref:sensor histidine kinase n=1 Tax=unclassified Microbacterium TaxID=2609290 RepID=UPI000EAA0CBF|nr:MULTISPECIES: histidine kinase [unclassified Microbacterium]MBT2483502.1 two-component sensor histidine kinase [Microbacterium sp. ISL-108]RKN66521.1 ATPase [Microbacterium sp. CGR2]